MAAAVQEQVVAAAALESLEKELVARVVCEMYLEQEEALEAQTE